MALKPGNTLSNGRYRIIKPLARGGFGFVYLAQDTLMDEEVAIKELIPALIDDETILKRFITEAKAAMHLRHPNVVATYNVFADGENYYLVMEYMPAGSLEDLLRRQGKLKITQALRTMAYICNGLAYAHDMGVVHCDIKPANVLFAADGTAKLADFGIAYISPELVGRSWRTPRDFAAGTLLYMAPEQVDGVRDDPRLDIYALGAMLYQMLTGRPYLDFDLRETPGAQADNVNRIRCQMPMPPRSVNPAIQEWLEGVVLKALAKDARHRHQSVGEMREALEKVWAPAPILRVTPVSLDFGSLDVGKRKALNLQLTNEGGGTLEGTFTTNQPWLRACQNSFSGNAISIRITVDVRGLQPKRHYQGVVGLHSNGGTVSVPLRVHVSEPAPSMLSLLKGKLRGLSTKQTIAIIFAAAVLGLVIMIIVNPPSSPLVKPIGQPTARIVAVTPIVTAMPTFIPTNTPTVTSIPPTSTATSTATPRPLTKTPTATITATLTKMPKPPTGTPTSTRTVILRPTSPRLGTFLFEWGSSKQFKRVRDLAVDTDNNIYVYVLDEYRIQKFDSDGKFLDKWGILQSGEDKNIYRPYCCGIAVDTSGNIYVVDSEHHRVLKFKGTGDFVTDWGTWGWGDGQFVFPEDIAVDTEGNIHVADTNNDRIQKFTSSGVFISKWSGDFHLPHSIGVDGNGNVYVADFTDCRVHKFSSNGRFLGKWSIGEIGISGFFDIAVDTQGNVYIANPFSNCVQKFDSNGKLLGRWSTKRSGDEEFFRPGDIAIDTNGNVYVVDSGADCILKYWGR